MVLHVSATFTANPALTLRINVFVVSAMKGIIGDTRIVILFMLDGSILKRITHCISTGHGIIGKILIYLIYIKKCNIL